MRVPSNKKQMVWVELMFSFHRRFARGPEIHIGYERDHFTYTDPANKNDSWRWINSTEAYQVGFSLGDISGVTLKPGTEAMYVTAPRPEPDFNKGFSGVELEDVNLFPFTLIDMDLFRFKNTDRITGRLNIKLEKDGFVVLADFATLPPYKFNEYKEEFTITTNNEFKVIVDKLNRLFVEVTEREY